MLLFLFVVGLQCTSFQTMNPDCPAKTTWALCNAQGSGCSWNGQTCEDDTCSALTTFADCKANSKCYYYLAAGSTPKCHPKNDALVQCSDAKLPMICNQMPSCSWINNQCSADPCLTKDPTSTVTCPEPCKQSVVYNQQGPAFTACRSENHKAGPNSTNCVGAAQDVCWDPMGACTFTAGGCITNTCQGKSAVECVGLENCSFGFPLSQDPSSPTEAASCVATNSIQFSKPPCTSANIEICLRDGACEWVPTTHCQVSTCAKNANETACPAATCKWAVNHCVAKDAVLYDGTCTSAGKDNCPSWCKVVDNACVNPDCVTKIAADTCQTATDSCMGFTLGTTTVVCQSNNHPNFGGNCPMYASKFFCESGFSNCKWTGAGCVKQSCSAHVAKDACVADAACAYHEFVNVKQQFGTICMDKPVNAGFSAIVSNFAVLIALVAFFAF